MININRNSHAGYRRRGDITPPILNDGNTVAWFDSAENITKDGSDFVSVWGDKSGLSHDLLQATGTNQPLHTADGVLFDGVDNFMKCAAFTLNQPEQIYIVFKQVTWTNNNGIFDGDGLVTGLMSTEGSTPRLIVKTDASSAQNANLAVDTFGIARVLINGASSSFQINETTAVTGDFGTRDMGGFTLGGAGGGIINSHIQVKEVIIRKIVDTAPNEQIIYDYLADKYSI